MFKISLTGDLGSGKSTVCDLLMQKIPAQLVSIGKIMRERGKQLGMTLEQYTKYMETHKEEDNALDEITSAYDKKDGDFIFDSRMAWHFVPSAFSFYLQISSKEGAKRIHGANRADEKFSSAEEVEQEIIFRRKSERQRYQQFYGVDILDLNNYDAVINTEGKTAQQVADEIIAIYNQRR